MLHSIPTKRNASIIITTIYVSLWKYFNVIIFHGDVQLSHYNTFGKIFLNKYKYILDQKEFLFKLTVIRAMEKLQVEHTLQTIIPRSIK